MGKFDNTIDYVSHIVCFIGCKLKPMFDLLQKSKSKFFQTKNGMSAANNRWEPFQFLGLVIYEYKQQKLFRQYIVLNIICIKRYPNEFVWLASLSSSDRIQSLCRACTLQFRCILSRTLAWLVDFRIPLGRIQKLYRAMPFVYRPQTIYEFNCLYNVFILLRKHETTETR